VANLFIHFEPIETTPQQDNASKSAPNNNVAQKEVEEVANLPKYILPESPEAERIKARPWKVRNSCFLV
jgi:hypothetical protein